MEFEESTVEVTTNATSSASQSTDRAVKSGPEIEAFPTRQPHNVDLAPVLSLSAFAALIILSAVWKYVARLRRKRMLLRAGNDRKGGYVDDEGGGLPFGLESSASRCRAILIASCSSDEDDVQAGHYNRREMRETDAIKYLNVQRTPSLLRDLQHEDERPTLLFERKGSRSGDEAFFACASCRDRKLCRFYMKVSEWNEQKADKLVVHCLDRLNIEFKGLTPRSAVERVKSSLALEKLEFDPENNSFGERGISLILGGFEGKDSGLVACLDCKRVTVPGENISQLCLDEGHDLRTVSLGNDAEKDFNLDRRTNNKMESQFIFDSDTISAMSCVFRNAAFENFICVGCPSLHFLLRSSGKNSLLMDIDERFHFLCDSKTFCHFNAVNGHFFHTKHVFEDWKETIGDGSVAIVVDMPFGSRIDALSRVLIKLRDDLGRKDRIFFFVVFPYFMEKALLECMPELVMMDLVVSYANHSKFKSGTKRGSPVRIFTDFPEFSLKGIPNYRWMDRRMFTVVNAKSAESRLGFTAKPVQFAT
ncbi:unnamed protein product [Notodromas monacha]|uniref:Uncharacterized protein n=1 Tax=Notodromas monacha TaxID=399045 RepID=A0A7R9BEB2_9CRUS|nr:unnamed protein product [Notodromas monacha]CAG0913092.1 unnamed protein product [Notodromas monacha]